MDELIGQKLRFLLANSKRETTACFRSVPRISISRNDSISNPRSKPNKRKQKEKPLASKEGIVTYLKNATSHAKNRKILRVHKTKRI